MEFEVERVLIIIYSGLKHIEKKGEDYMLHVLLGAEIGADTLAITYSNLFKKNA